MEKRIKLSGLSTNPSDYSCEDCNIASAINVVHDDGAIKSPEFTAPKLKEDLGANVSVLYQHKTQNKSIFIKKDSSTGKYFYTIEDATANILDIEWTVKGRVSSDDNSVREFFEINEGDSVDLVDYPTSYDFDVFVYPKLLLNGEDVSSEVTSMTYYQNRTNGKTGEPKGEKIGHYNSITSIEPMSTSSIAEDLIYNGEFHMRLDIVYKGITVSKTLNFTWEVDTDPIPSEITPYVGNTPKAIPWSTWNELSEVSGKNIVNIESIGSTIIIFTDDDPYYYIFKHGVYSFIGTHIPYLDMSFTLEGHFYHNGTSAEDSSGEIDDWDDYKAETFYGRFFKPKDLETNEENREYTINASLAEANKFVSEATEKGYFSQPFLVRYAYRLYDGTNVMASAPVLMTPSTHNPIIQVQESSVLLNTGSMVAEGVICKLLYNTDGVDLNEWKDIISGVDIYISTPFFSYKQSKAELSDYLLDTPSYLTDMKSYPQANEAIFQIKDQDPQSYRDGKSMFAALKKAYGDGVIAEAPYGLDEETTWFIDKNGTRVGRSANSTYYSVNGIGNFLYFSLDYKTQKDIKKEISDCGTFYLLKELEISDLVKTDHGTEIEIPTGYLTSIGTKDVLVEDYESFHYISSKNSITYNNRVTLYNIIKKYFKGFTVKDMSQYVTGDYYVDETGEITTTLNLKEFVTVVTIDNGEKIITKCNGEQVRFGYDPRISYLFYPDANAKKVELYYQDGSKIYSCSFDLIEHPFLNGAYYANGTGLSTLSNVKLTEYGSLEDVYNTLSSDETSSVQNELRTSDVNDPFVFKAANVETIGNGKIIALVPQATALSQGQFGEYPMMCFTSDGIWALSVNETGGWSAKQPFSRDVVLNEDAGNILQLDRQVMFASNRGLMLISGSNVECISEVFDGFKDTFKIYDDESLDDGYESLFASVIGNKALSDITTVREDVSSASDVNHRFLDFIGNAVFLYDYTHQRIIIGNEDYPFAFVFNMKDKLWTSINQRITSSVNSYPNCYAMTKVGQTDNYDNLLVDFSATDGDASQVGLPTNGFVLTRPIKLDAPDVLKTVSLVVARGNMSRSSVDLILLASRDLTNWVIVKAVQGNRLSLTHGTAYKYFRVGIITRLAKGESLDSLDIQYEVKQDNKIR